MGKRTLTGRIRLFYTKLFKRSLYTRYDVVYTSCTISVWRKKKKPVHAYFNVFIKENRREHDWSRIFRTFKRKRKNYTRAPSPRRVRNNGCRYIFFFFSTLSTSFFFLSPPPYYTYIRVVTRIQKRYKLLFTIAT